MIKLLILGPAGSMGKLITELSLTDQEVQVVAACDVSHIGELLGSLVSTKDPNNIIINDVNNLQKVIEETQPDVAVDFTTAEATQKNCIICARNGIRCVIGTTAMSKEFYEDFEKLVKENKAPAVISPNMATGVNVLFKIASILTSYLSDWDIEIIESHHNRKQDNYSGTSLKILDIICKTLEVNKEEVVRYGRSLSKILRKKGAKNEIGIHCIRAGDIVGDHTVLYAGPGERIELRHQAHSRICFANGAIKAIKFIYQKTEPEIYSMSDVLGLN